MDVSQKNKGVPNLNMNKQLSTVLPLTAISDLRFDFHLAK